MRIAFDTGGANIPGDPNRRTIAFRNMGTTRIYWGWEPLTAATGPVQGIPLEPNATEGLAGEGMILDGKDKAFRAIYFATETTGIVTYSEDK